MVYQKITETFIDVRIGKDSIKQIVIKKHNITTSSRGYNPLSNNPIFTRNISDISSLSATFRAIGLFVAGPDPNKVLVNFPGKINTFEFYDSTKFDEPVNYGSMIAQLEKERNALQKK